LITTTFPHRSHSVHGNHEGSALNVSFSATAAFGSGSVP
jgi:hypothetical protein